eukprot:m.304236 g.304236  ORF g.304236 m.304236 type:complete len:95 (-) comp27316_c0_seq2:760-1044(-)
MNGLDDVTAKNPDAKHPPDGDAVGCCATHELNSARSATVENILRKRAVCVCVLELDQVSSGRDATGCTATHVPIQTTQWQAGDAIYVVHHEFKK